MPVEAGADAWAILIHAISSRAEDDPPKIDVKVTKFLTIFRILSMAVLRRFATHPLPIRSGWVARLGSQRDGCRRECADISSFPARGG